MIIVMMLKMTKMNISTVMKKITVMKTMKRMAMIMMIPLPFSCLHWAAVLSPLS